MLHKPTEVAFYTTKFGFMQRDSQPSQPLAKQFIDFVMSPAGQALWAYKRGVPGGPERYALRRTAIQPALFAPALRSLRSDPDDNPYRAAEGFTYHAAWTGPLFRALRVRPLRALGRLSYGAYVFDDMPHQILFLFLLPFCRSRIQTEWMTAAVALPLTVLVAALSFRFWESWWLERKERWTRTASDRPASVSAAASSLSRQSKDSTDIQAISPGWS